LQIPRDKYLLKFDTSEFITANLYNLNRLFDEKSTIIISNFFILASGQNAAAQELLETLPATKEGYIASEKKVLATIDWIENTPFDQVSDTGGRF
jgi:hypothetical protein